MPHEINLPRQPIANDPTFEVDRIQTMDDGMEIDHSGTDHEYHSGVGIFPSQFRPSSQPDQQ